MKVVINTSPGGFNLSQKAYEWLLELGVPCYPYGAEVCWGEFGINIDYHGLYYDSFFYLNRTNPLLISVVEFLGDEASTIFSALKVVEIPDNVEFTVEQNEHGMEWVAEKHRTWS